MRILGINTGNKESSAALVVNGRIAGAVLEERLSRRHKDAGLPERAIAHLLADNGLQPADIDAVVGTLSPRRLAEVTGEPAWARARAFPRREDAEDQRGLHHQSHAALAFATSGLAQALVVTVDNHGDSDTLVVWRADRAGLVRLGSVPWQPLPIGGVYEEATARLGFGEGGEGRLMGLAGFGAANPGWSHAFLRAHAEAWAVTSDWLGPPSADPAVATLQRMARASWTPIDFAQHAAFAASVQKAIEDTVLDFVRAAHAETGLRDICLGGGVALNCSLNGRIGREPWVRTLWVPPSPGDPGNALGAALLAAARWGQPHTTRLEDGGLGPQASKLEVVTALQRAGLAGWDAGLSAAQAAAAAATDLATGAVIGWVEGRSEFGPRALGHRSILADPRRTDLRDRCNVVKLREEWRPVAPAILAEHQGDWLVDRHPSPFMLLAMQALPRLSDLAPGAVHVDGTVRAQTVSTASQPGYRGLLQAFYAATGVPLVLNTSFNQGGEPIVETPQDAVDCARRAGLDVLYLDGVRLPLERRARPLDGRLARLEACVSGRVGGVWPDLLARSKTLRLASWCPVAHTSAVVTSRAVETLGLATTPVTPSPLLVTDGGSLAWRAVAQHRGLVFVASPIFSLDDPVGAGVLPAGLHLAPAPVFLPGVQVLAQTLARSADLQTLHVHVTTRPSPLADPGPGSDHMLLVRLALAEALCVGLALAQAGGAQGHGISGSLTGAAERELYWSGWMGAVPVQVTLTAAPAWQAPAIEAGTATGSWRLSAQGRLTEQQGDAPVRWQDHGMSWTAWLPAVEKRLSLTDTDVPTAVAAGHWPLLADAALALYDAADSSVQAWRRLRLADPGGAALLRRAAAAVTASEGPAALLPRPAALRWAAVSLLVHPLAQLVAVAAGVRPAARIEQVSGTIAEHLQTLATSLGLCVAWSTPYAHQAPQRQAVRSDMASHQSLYIAKEQPRLAELVALDQQLPGESRPLVLNDLRRRLGAAYGYPDCCVSAWLRLETLGLQASFTYAIVESTRGSWLGGCNHRPSAKWIAHFPCNYSCQPTADLAQRVLQAFVERQNDWPMWFPNNLLAQLPSPLATALRDLWVLPPAALYQELTALTGGPLLYIDPTCWISLVGGRVERLHADGVSDHFVVSGAEMVSSADLGWHPDAPEEHVLQEALFQEVVVPLRALLARGPLHIYQQHPGHLGAVRLDNGPETEASAPATLSQTLVLPQHLGLFLPFGLEEQGLA